MPPNHLILCYPLLLIPSIFPSIRVFSNESAVPIRWPKYFSFKLSINSSNEYSGLISFRIDLLDLFTVQGTLKSLLQHHSSKASTLRGSDFLMVQLSHPYMTTGKTVAFTRWTFVGKVMSLLFNMLSRLVIAFLPRSKHLLMSRLQSPSAVTLEPRKKSVTMGILCQMWTSCHNTCPCWLSCSQWGLCPTYIGLLCDPSSSTKANTGRCFIITFLCFFVSASFQKMISFYLGVQNFV